MSLSEYPENRLHIVVDENGNITYRQDPEFLKYYNPTPEEIEEELEDLEYQLEMKLLMNRSVLSTCLTLNTMTGKMSFPNCGKKSGS